MSQPTSQHRQPYGKPWLSHADQLRQLVARGLVVDDQASAEAFLAHVNYYRLSGYCLAFEQSRHEFADGCTFADVRAAYEFDLGLRDIVTDALEILEVDFRATIAHEFGRTYGPFGHVSPSAFFKTFKHGEWLAKVRSEADRSRESFVDHFRTRYVEFPDLPIWIATEAMSFGALSFMFAGMTRRDEQPIAARYRLQPFELAAALHHLVYVRNLCAHHSRLWDRAWSIKPVIPRGKAWQPPWLPRGDRLFASLLLQFHLLKHCRGVQADVAGWRDRVRRHLDSPPPVPDACRRMGMPREWRDHPVWK